MLWTLSATVLPKRGNGSDASAAVGVKSMTESHKFAGKLG